MIIQLNHEKNRSLPKFLIALVLFIPAYGFSQTYLDVEKYKSKIGAPINNILKNFKQKKIEQESFGISIKSVHINKYYYLISITISLFWRQKIMIKWAVLIFIAKLN